MLLWLMNLDFAGSPSVAALSYSPLKSLVYNFDPPDLGMTLGMKGNMLPLTVVTTIPTTAPPGGQGAVFYVSGGALTIYVWDPVTTAWIT